MRAEILNSFPAVNEELAERLLEEELKKDGHKIVVLDDDPTGVQTVHGVSVYTDWSPESIRRGFEEEGKLFYILTNSRSLTEEQTKKVHTEIGRNIARTARELQKSYVIISRGDSTLRGHYPLETEILRRMIRENEGVETDGEILCPYFREGGRFTIGGVHYVKYGEELVPAGETEFSRDRTFGYRASSLRDYVEEKTKGEYRAEDVTEITIEELRAMDYSGITEKLCNVTGFGKVAVNAAADCDLKVFCTCLYRAMALGHRFLFRTAAGFVKVFSGISDRPLLSGRELTGGKERKNGGLIIAGSHTQKTTEQLRELEKLPEIEFLEFNSDLVLDREAFEQEIERVVRKEEELIQRGKTVAVYTKRRLLEVEGDTPQTALLRSVAISDAVQSLVGRLGITPAFVIAKGGITSSDVGTKALKVKQAQVLGQICPGVPVWRTGKESRFPEILYVIFPGNVGDASALRQAVEVLEGKRQRAETEKQ